MLAAIVCHKLKPTFLFATLCAVVRALVLVLAIDNILDERSNCIQVEKNLQGKNI